MTKVLAPSPSELFPVDGIAGKRVSLRRFTTADINQRYLGWLNDTKVTRFSNQRFAIHNMKTARAYLDSFSGSPNLFLLVSDRGSGETLGTMTAYTFLPHSTVDVGIMLGESTRWGQGLGSEAWCLLVEWLIGEVGVRKLTAGCAAGNRGMKRLAEGSGMRLEAIKRAHEIIDGEPQDLLYYARFRDL
jgi:ribosomal-protein-alanine N-acetyltransferase